MSRVAASTPFLSYTTTRPIGFLMDGIVLEPRDARGRAGKLGGHEG
jgi:hypothetical protein